MPQVIYLPKPINPLTDQLPQFLQQLVLLKMGHKMDMEKAQTAAKLSAAQKTSETQEKAENKGFRPGPWDTSQPGVATIGGTPYKAPASPTNEYLFNPTKGDFGEYEQDPAKKAQLDYNLYSKKRNMDYDKKVEFLGQQEGKDRRITQYRDSLQEGREKRIAGYREAIKRPGMSEAELTQRALNGDVESQKILDSMSQRRQINVNAPSEEEAVSIAESIGDGELAPKSIPKRGKLWATSVAKVTEKYPKFNFAMADANYNYRNNASILRSAGQVKAATPRVVDLYQKASELANSAGVPLIDSPLNEIKRALGNEAVADFESLRNAILTEVNSALSGSSTASDFRIKLELENLKSGMTLGQQIKSIDNLISALDARGEASEIEVYPLDVVRGVKTFDQWKHEQKKDAASVRKMKFSGSGSAKGGGLESLSDEELLKQLELK